MKRTGIALTIVVVALFVGIPLVLFWPQKKVADVLHVGAQADEHEFCVTNITSEPALLTTSRMEVKINNSWKRYPLGVTMSVHDDTNRQNVVAGKIDEVIPPHGVLFLTVKGPVDPIPWRLRTSVAPPLGGARKLMSQLRMSFRFRTMPPAARQLISSMQQTLGSGITFDKPVEIIGSEVN